MNILFAASENAWGGFLERIRSKLPGHHFRAAGSFHIDSLKGVDVLIPAMTWITREMMETGDRLRLIQQCGSGLEGVDIKAATDQGVSVANVPAGTSGNADSVAELGIYMMIGLSRNIQGMAQSLRNKKMGEPLGMALPGKTVGIIGLGGIGQALVQRLKPFGVKLMGIKRTNPQQAKDTLGLDWAGTPADLPFLLENCDYVLVCVPATPESSNMIDGRAFARMKKTAFLINLSRGALVNRDALEHALESGAIAGVGLDVFWQEPPDPSDPIFNYNVMATPHIAGATDISMERTADGVAENIRRLAENRPLLHLHQ
ncbi:SerA2 [Desulforapulum autotrophicum HRM2]|uniref:SerA2 n=1 Tax=Desulforapulum autotrophicum (strain ATCC 43914 / DSM 3382 / VKM B-1955 / HRM2) TaxID=177437 RepID=C0QHG2_DESAH|nr:2-hydroxyacid dehydrogenase [Desulforapulum autotrophicum]ACN17821.1 SerA2 [Desulforapulum autotrophicum HRM2]